MDTDLRTATNRDGPFRLQSKCFRMVGSYTDATRVTSGGRQDYLLIPVLQFLESDELRPGILNHQFPPNFIEHHRAHDEERVPPDLLAEPAEDALIPWMLLEELGDRIGVE